MTYRPSVLGCILAVLAIVVAGVEVDAVVAFMMEQHAPVYMLAGSALAAGLMPALPTLAGLLRRARSWGAVLVTYAAFVVALILVVTSAVQRTGTATDMAEEQRTLAKRAAGVAEATERQAVADYMAAQSAALTECKDARGRRCMDAEAKAELRRQELARARAALVVAPAAHQVDPGARRLAGVFPITEEQVRLYQPLLWPLLMSLLSYALFAAWLAIDFGKTSPASIEEPPKREPLTVARFLFQHTADAPGERIEMEQALYNAYRVACIKEACVPSSPAVFGEDLAKVIQMAGLQVDIDVSNGEGFLLNRRLAA